MSKPIQILLVDGHAVVRKALQALIDTEPDMKVVGEAADSPGAVEQARLHQPDVIILDHSTLDDEGLAVVTSFMKIFPQPHVLLLTNEIDKGEIWAAIDAGAKGYLLKGTAALEILQSIRNLSRGQSIIAPLVTIALL